MESVSIFNVVMQLQIKKGSLNVVKILYHSIISDILLNDATCTSVYIPTQYGRIAKTIVRSSHGIGQCGKLAASRVRLSRYALVNKASQGFFYRVALCVPSSISHIRIILVVVRQSLFNQ